MTAPISPEALIADLDALRTQGPLVHNITNYVVMEVTANALLAAGASPVMAHASEEVEDMTMIAGSLVLNIGTLSPAWVEAMHKAAAKARALGKPVVMDPVGVGATAYRTETARALLDSGALCAVRGNASEVAALAGEAVQTKGVDSTAATAEVEEVGQAFAARTGLVVTLSGAVDVVTDGTTVVRIANGDAMMGRITGMGCTATALIGAFLAVNPDPLAASAHAMVYLGLAGELAARGVAGPGSFRVAILDALYGMKPQDILSGWRAEIVGA
jgi:hydroxyethylthiazole kinase